MSLFCSDHNYYELHDLNKELQECAFLFNLLRNVPDSERDSSFHSLLDTYACRVSDVAFSFRLFEDCLWMGRDFNSKSPSAEQYVEGACSPAELPTTEQSEEAPLLNDEPPDGL